jgi:DNA-binding FadR family transcriptional regulator
MIGSEPNAVDGRAVIVPQPVRTAYQQVADQLRDAILSGELPPGHKLPLESELQGLFHVSRSTVREALRALSSQNLIVTTRGAGGGSVVAWPDAAQVSADLEAKIGLLAGVNYVSVDDLLQARGLLEVPAARLAAQRRTASQLREIEACVTRPGRPSLPDTHMQFHRAVLEAAGNPLLTVMTAPVFRVLQVRFLRDAAPKRFWHDVEVDHGQLLEAIRNSDGFRAEQLMSEHLHKLRATYVAIDRPDRALSPGVVEDPQDALGRTATVGWSE